MKKIIDFFKGVKQGMQNFGHAIGSIINTVSLTIVYFLGVGITSLFLKVMKKNFVHTKIDKLARTYWKDLNIGDEPSDDYFKQY